MVLSGVNSSAAITAEELLQHYERSKPTATQKPQKKQQLTEEDQKQLGGEGSISVKLKEVSELIGGNPRESILNRLRRAAETLE